MQSFQIYEMATGEILIDREFADAEAAGKKRRSLQGKLGRDLGMIRVIDPATDGAHIVRMVRRYREEVLA